MALWSRTRSDHPGHRLSSVAGFVVLSILVVCPPLPAQTDFWELPSFGLSSTVLGIASSPRGYLFAGTDDRKVVRSSDGGVTWIDVGGAELSPIVWSVAVDSVGTVFAGTDFRGVFRSMDDGSTWVPSNLTLERISCILLTSQGTAFAGVWDKGIYRSTDGGLIWSLAGAAGHKVRSIVETPDGVLVAATDTTAQEGRLYRSSDGGTDWARIGTGLASGVVHALVSVSAETLFAGTAGQGIYLSTNTGAVWTSSYLLIPSTVSTLVKAGGEGIFAGTLLGGGGILRTTDGGEHWLFEVSGLLNLDVRSLTLGHDGRLYAGTGEGLYRSTDILTSLDVNDNLSLASALKVTAHPNPFNGETILMYYNPKPGPVRLSAYDLRGRRIPIFEDSLHPPGSYRVRWVADNRASGVYVIVLEAAGGMRAEKILLLK